jgi:hypothetical protein
MAVRKSTNLLQWIWSYILGVKMGIEGNKEKQASRS